MTKIKLEINKLVGFRILASEAGADQQGAIGAKPGENQGLKSPVMELKTSAKIGSKFGGKLGGKLGGKIGGKIGLKADVQLG